MIKISIDKELINYDIIVEYIINHNLERNKDYTLISGYKLNQINFKYDVEYYFNDLIHEHLIQLQIL